MHSGAQAARFQPKMSSTAGRLPAALMTTPTMMGDRMRHVRSIRRMPVPTLSAIYDWLPWNP